MNHRLFLKSNPVHLPFRLIFILLFLILSGQSFAGWFIIGRYIDKEGNTILRRFFIEGNSIKFEQYNFLFTYNFTTEKLILVNPDKLTYTSTTLSDYVKYRQSVAEQRMHQALAEVPGPEKSSYEKTYRQNMQREWMVLPYPADSVQIIAMPDTTRHMGQTVYKFKVDARGGLREECWYSPAYRCFTSIDEEKLALLWHLFFPEDHTYLYSQSAAYRQQVGQALVVRRFMSENASKTEWQVNNVEERHFQPYEFGKPDLCRELTLSEWFGQSKTDDGDYDDYE